MPQVNNCPDLELIHTDLCATGFNFGIAVRLCLALKGKQFYTRIYKKLYFSLIVYYALSYCIFEVDR